jgi:diguanylate cyclase (GGDEF)-like protein
MEDRTGLENTVEVVEQLQEEQIDLRVVRWVAGDREPRSNEKHLLEQLRRERGDGFYSDLSFALCGCRYPQSEAYRIWAELVSHRDELRRILGRNPGVVVAALDWFSNFRGNDVPEFSLVESKKLENMLERAVVDGLTGLYDHETLLTLLEKEIERGKRHTERLSLLLLDLDDFKQINDEYGHLKGDEVLAGVADSIKQTIRSMDIAGRYGGEEFAVILPEAGLSAAVQTAERLREVVEERFCQDIRLTVSLGVSCFPDDSSVVDGLVKIADEALYLAKSRGKNCVVSAQEAWPSIE